MTLDTRIYVLSPIDADDLFKWVNTKLLRAESPSYSCEETVDGHIHFANAPGQGFDAWFMLDAWGTPQRFDDGIDDSWDEDDIEYHREKQERIGSPYYALLSFDTSYGFKKNDMGCTELHATYIVRLYREYFEPRGIDIVWADEYSGDHWKNLNEVGMTNFLGSGDTAQNWFNHIVKPTIEKVAQAEGGEVEWL